MERGEEKKQLDEEFWQLYPELYELLKPEVVTDVNFNSGQLWVSTVNRIPEVVKNEKINQAYMYRFAIAVANRVGKEFNPTERVVCGDGENIRITCIEPSQSVSGISVCIRKFLPGLRFTWQEAIEKKYATEECMNLIRNCVLARKSFTFCGLPKEGKTEGMRFFSQFIRKYEHTLTIEDTPEINYSNINPGGCHSALRVINGDYEECLTTALRMSPDWIEFGESRGREVKYLLECWSNGVPLMTTIHTDDAGEVPERILNMLGDRQDADRIVSEVYKNLDVSILVKKKVHPDKSISRHIDQVYFYYRKDGKNHLAKVVENGELFKDRLPAHIKDEIEKAVGHGAFEAPKSDEEVL